jgi:hypothetical protein
MIIASAIKTKDGRLFVGKRHSDCFANAKRFTNLLMFQMKL